MTRGTNTEHAEAQKNMLIKENQLLVRLYIHTNTYYTLTDTCKRKHRIIWLFAHFDQSLLSLACVASLMKSLYYGPSLNHDKKAPQKPLLFSFPIHPHCHTSSNITTTSDNLSLENSNLIWVNWFTEDITSFLNNAKETNT